MIGVALDETLRGGNRTGRIFVLVIGVSEFQLRLLREAAIGEAPFKLLVVAYGSFVRARVQCRARFGIELLRRPALGFIGLVGEPAASGEHPTQY